MKTKIFLQKGLDDPNHIESFQEIAIYVNAISEASRQASKATSSRNSTALPTRPPRSRNSRAG
jgi:hypothetical protein